MKRILIAKFNPIFATGYPTRLHMRTDLHLARKVWHMGMGLLIAFIYWGGMSRMTGVSILASVLVWDLVVEGARLRFPTINEKVLRVLGPIMRHSEMDRMSGTPHYLAASIIAIAVFPRPVAVLSIMYLACGDPVASLFGILYGKKSIRFANGKSLVGTAAGVVTCMLVSFLFLNTLPLHDSTILLLSLIGGLAGGTAELLPFEVDDNFSIPVISGFILWLAFILVGI